MNNIRDHLAAGLIAAVVTGIVAGAVIWKITAAQHDFVAAQFAAQDAKFQAVNAALAKTADDFKQLDGALQITETTLREVKDQVALVGTRTGIAQLNTMVKDVNKALADIKQATAPEQAKAALAPLAGKLDTLSKAMAALRSKIDDKTRPQALDEALKRIETAIAGVKNEIAKQPTDPAITQANAKLAEVSKSLPALNQTLDALKSSVSANASKLDRASTSLTALSTTVKQGFADTAAKQAELSKAVAKAVAKSAPASPVKPKQDLVVFYVATAGKAAATPDTADRGSRADAGCTAAVRRALREDRRHRRCRPSQGNRRPAARHHEGSQRLHGRGRGARRHPRRRPGQLRLVEATRHDGRRQAEGRLCQRAGHDHADAVGRAAADAMDAGRHRK